jgi:peptide/nickel transport system substrate-binding protein
VVKWEVMGAHRWAAVMGAVALALPLTIADQPEPSAGGGLPRDKTLYTSGTATAPPTNFNPLDLAKDYTGSQGLLYEPLFLFDPVRGQFVPWLATSGGWAGPTTYKLQVRPGVSWTSSSSGSVTGALSGADVAYSINLAVRDPADPYNSDVTSVKSATATGGAVTVTFRAPVNYAQWEDFLWHAPVLPEATWSHMQPGTWATDANTSPVATGPMLLYARSATEACYRDNPNWWGRIQLGLSFKFEFLCDVVSRSSGAGLSDLLDNRTDWSNELLQGVPNLVGGKTAGYDIKTYYPSSPYMLPASTAWLEMNTARAPMSNVYFRRALAYAIDPATIISKVYSGTVEAANPTGLLPYLSDYINKVAVKSYGFYYSQSMAKQFLAKSGYKDQHLTLDVPVGWTDWMDAATQLSQQLQSIGIHVSARFVPADALEDDISSGNYDMTIADSTGLCPTPWSYYDAVYHLPINPSKTQQLNAERFSDTAAWALVRQAAVTPPTDGALLRSIYTVLESDFLQELPEVPLWYSGAWFQASTAYWQDYPSSTGRQGHYTPMMWPGWLGSTTTVYALAQLRPH